mgnify:CR=1 FL=1
MMCRTTIIRKIFYYDHADEFDDIQDAEDYWEEAQ